MTDLTKTIDGKKFMWDGEEYASEVAARETEAKYRRNGFTTRLIEEDGKYLVYSRRVAADRPIEGAPP